MKHRITFTALLIILLSGAIGAQPDEKYIQKLTGDVSSDWLNSISAPLPVNTLTWQKRAVHGFKSTSPNMRRQALLAHAWNFYPSTNIISNADAEQITLPHNFSRNRDYFSAWYISKFKVDKESRKKYVLMLNRVELFSMFYLNGKRIGHHFGGYTPFEMDVTDAMVQGDNVLAIFVYDQSAALEGDKVYNQVGVSYLGSYNPNVTADKSSGHALRRLPGGLGDVPVLEVREYANIKDVFVKTSTRKKEMEIACELSLNGKISSDAKVSFELFLWPTGKKVDLDIADIVAQTGTDNMKTVKVKWDDPLLWSPDHPNLYVLRTTLKNGKQVDVMETRFGFREFWVQGKSFMLNGTPIRIRGESHYRQDRPGVDFHRAIFKMHKDLFGSNACRIHATMPNGDIMLGADEAGMLLIDQSAIWSVNGRYYVNGGEWFAKNVEQEFKEWVRRDRNSPSVVIWDVENEMLRFNHDVHISWISKLPGYIQQLDTTRPINYSGAGWFSAQQDMVSLHMQEHYARIMHDWMQKDSRPLIMGEFWVGGRSEQRLPNSPEFASEHQRYIEEARMYEEKLLQMRYYGVSGIMPFRTALLAFPKGLQTGNNYTLDVKDSISIITQPDDVLQILRHALQPVTAFFWPRENYIDQSKSFERELVICNDGEREKSFEVEWKWDGKKGGSKTISLQPAQQHRIVINRPSIQNASQLTATVSTENKVLSADTLFVQAIKLPQQKIEKIIQVYKDTALVEMLAKIGISAISSSKIPVASDNVIWLIPEHADNRELTGIKNQILDFLDKGGSMLCLKQDQAPTWFPIKYQFGASNQSALHNYKMMGWEGLNKDIFFATEAPIYANSHPVFEGIESKTLHLWDRFDGRVCDDVFARPASSDKYEPGNWRTLAGGTRREHISLGEIFYGKGTMLACQLNVIDNLDNIQARALVLNMFNYLSGKKAIPLNGKIELAGDLIASNLAKLTGAKAQAFEGASVENGDLMLAFDGADVAKIKAWATKGGQVLLMSDSLSQTFGALTNNTKSKDTYLATKIADIPLLCGVSSGNFLDSQSSIITNFFKTVPANAKVLMQGFSSSSTYWRVEDAGSVMVSVPFGKGEVILSTIQIDKNSNASAREFLSLILTNAGVEVPFLKEVETGEITIKKTVPIKVDGVLNEWLEDMEDRLVNPYVHAQPIYLTSQNIIRGPQAFDLDLSAINYMLWNDKGLHLAGVVFMEKRFFGAEPYPGVREYRQEFNCNDDLIAIDVVGDKAQVWVNGEKLDATLVKTGQINTKDMTDATRLQFDYIHASGKIATLNQVSGQTFEVTVPWDILKSITAQKPLQTLISLESKETKIQEPLKANPSSKNHWLDMKFSHQDK